MTASAQQRTDLAIAAGAAALLVAEILTSSAIDGPRVANVVVLVPVAVALYWRRRRPSVPLLALAIAYPLSGLLLTDIEELSTTLVPALLTAYAIGRYADDLRPAALGAIWVVSSVNLLSVDAIADDWIFPFIALGVACATGRALRTRALVAAELAERTERLAVEHELRAAEAAVEERRRIARELHDVVAHTLSVMVVQAGGARRQLGRDPQRSAQALEIVEATGRSALGELRRMLGFVSEGSGISGAASTAPAPLEPQPALADIMGLVRRASAAGLPTRLTVEGRPDPARPLAAGAEVAAFRIVQEALTNALKHAGPGATATVVLRWCDDELHVVICDDGAGTSAGHALPSGGHGLIGMRERVALYGGELEAGPRPGGGFRVAASLPRAAAAPAVPA